MASQNINVGTNADDGTGESLRSAFIDIRKMFAEVYGQTYTSDTQDLSGATFEIDSDQIVDGAIDEVHLNATNSPSANQILQWDGSTGFTWVDQFDGDITSVVAGYGLTGGATEDDATLNVVGGDGITANADEVEVTVDDSTIELSASDGTGAIRIKDDGVTHDKLAARYTSSESVTSASSITINTENADIFTWTAGHSATIDFTNVKIGDVVTLQVTGGGGSYTLTLQNINASAGTFNKIAGDYDDTSATKNLIEFKFISTSEAWYQISQIAS